MRCKMPGQNAERPGKLLERADSAPPGALPPGEIQPVPITGAILNLARKSDLVCDGSDE